jgi:DNA-binding GntR family transcriptional regulator
MTGLPQYKKLYEELRRRIAEGVYVPGDLLPSENRLAGEYGITRPTIRTALARLVDDGFIVKQQGKGSVVKGAPKGLGILSLSGTTSAVGEERLSTRIIVRPQIRPWPEEAFGFPVEPSVRAGGCIYFERLRFLNDVPLFFDITMLPDVLPGFLRQDLEDCSLFEFLRTRYRLTVSGGTQHLFAIRADRRLRDYFHVQTGFPVLQLNRRIETNRPDFCFYSQVFCVTQGYALTGNF